MVRPKTLNLLFGARSPPRRFFLSSSLSHIDFPECSKSPPKVEGCPPFCQRLAVSQLHSLCSSLLYALSGASLTCTMLFPARAFLDERRTFARTRGLRLHLCFDTGLSDTRGPGTRCRSALMRKELVAGRGRLLDGSWRRHSADGGALTRDVFVRGKCLPSAWMRSLPR